MKKNDDTRKREIPYTAPPPLMTRGVLATMDLTRVLYWKMDESMTRFPTASPLSYRENKNIPPPPKNELSEHSAKPNTELFATVEESKLYKSEKKRKVHKNQEQDGKKEHTSEATAFMVSSVVGDRDSEMTYTAPPPPNAV